MPVLSQFPLITLGTLRDRMLGLNESIVLIISGRSLNWNSVQISAALTEASSLLPGLIKQLLGYKEYVKESTNIPDTGPNFSSRFRLLLYQYYFIL
jgi:hypothetical protein